MAGQSLTRRGALAGLGGLAMAGTPRRSARAATTLTVLSHEAMKSAATKGAGGDVTEQWQKDNNCEINWITLDVVGIGNRLLREASLGEAGIDVGYIQYNTSRTMALMEPLEPFMKAAPIEDQGPDLSDFPPTLLNLLKYKGAICGVPVRVVSQSLFYNEALFEERGVTSLPKTFEEFEELARKMTFTRPDGSKVYGLICSGTPEVCDGYASFARAFDGDFMTMDQKLVANQPGMVKGLEALARFYKDGVLPPETFTMNPEINFNWMQQGRTAIQINTVARLPSINNPKSTKYAGKIKIMEFPMTSSLVGKVKYAPELSSWSLVIPKTSNPARKQLAWSFIRNLTTRENTVKSALNGNGPARISAYSDPRLAGASYIQTMVTALRDGRVVLPPFANQTKAESIFVEESEAVILGHKKAQEAMDEAVARVKPLV